MATSSQARPKRAAEAFHHRTQQRNAKTPRFDARNPSRLIAGDRSDGGEGDTNDVDALDDAILDADVIARGPATKRNAVNIDGYDSDSEDERKYYPRDAEGGTGGGKKEGGGGGGEDEDEMDMFADLEKADGDEDEDTVGRPGGGKRKDVRFLDQSEIAGQDMQSRGGGRVSNRLMLGGEGKAGRNGKGKGKQRRKGDGSESQSDLSSSISSSSSSSDDDDDDDDAQNDPEEELNRRDQDQESRAAARRATAHSSNLPEDLVAEVGAGGNKRHAPRLDAFNLRAEEDEGRFDADGNFVRHAADPDGDNDRWLDGVRRRDIKKAKEAHEARLKSQREKDLRDDEVLTQDLLSMLIRLLEVGETPLEALQRLNKGGKHGAKWTQKNKKKQRGRRRGDREGGEGGGEEGGAEVGGRTDEHIDRAMDLDLDAHTEDNNAVRSAKKKPIEAAEQQRREAVEAITGAADALYSRQQHDIYELQREMLMRQYKRETGEDWRAGGDEVTVTAAETDTTAHSDAEHIAAQGGGEGGGGGAGGGRNSSLWEYRWSDARDGGEIHGPYDSATMAAWRAAGYFGEGVEFRRVQGRRRQQQRQRVGVAAAGSGVDEDGSDDTNDDSSSGNNRDDGDDGWSRVLDVE